MDNQNTIPSQLGSVNTIPSQLGSVNTIPAPLISMGDRASDPSAPEAGPSLGLKLMLVAVAVATLAYLIN